MVPNVFGQAWSLEELPKEAQKGRAGEPVCTSLHVRLGTQLWNMFYFFKDVSLHKTCTIGKLKGLVMVLMIERTEHELEVKGHVRQMGG